MKTCLCCHTDHADEAPTCARCGEGSWGPTAPNPEAKGEGAETPADKPKRGGKGKRPTAPNPEAKGEGAETPADKGEG